MDGVERAKKEILHKVCIAVVEKFASIQLNITSKYQSNDKVFMYASNLLSLGCFYLEFSDGIREGDGNRVLRCWRYLLPMFFSSGRRNYALESLHFLVQHAFTLSPRQSAELLWSRFINSRGLPGHNIPNDLHMEHLNRLIKMSLNGLGANKTPKAITTAGRVLGLLGPIMDTFDAETTVGNTSGNHRIASMDTDLSLLLKELSTSFKEIPGRAHFSFPKPRHPLYEKSFDAIKAYIVDRVSF